MCHEMIAKALRASLSRAGFSLPSEVIPRAGRLKPALPGSVLSRASGHFLLGGLAQRNPPRLAPDGGLRCADPRYKSESHLPDAPLKQRPSFLPQIVVARTTDAPHRPEFLSRRREISLASPFGFGNNRSSSTDLSPDPNAERPFPLRAAASWPGFAARSCEEISTWNPSHHTRAPWGPR